MANPQPDQYTKLSNEILEAIMKSQFSKRQLNILFLIWRCSYGFNKKVARLKKSDFRYVGIYPGDITKELNYLQETKVIFWDEENDLIAFNKNYDRWRISLSRAVVNGQADISKILKRQFKKFSKTLNKDISKILNLPVDNSENVSKTLNNQKRKLSKTLSQNNTRVSKTLTFPLKKVSKTLTMNSSEPNSDGSHGVRKETKDKETKTVVVEEQKHKNIYNTYKKVFARLPSPFQIELLQAYVEDDGMDPEVVCEAIKIAGKNNALTVNYVTTILDSWRQRMVITLEDAEKAIEEFELKSRDRSSPNRNQDIRGKQEKFKAEYR